MAQPHSTTTKNSYKHLTPFERGKISILLKKGRTQGDIAKALDRCKSTISREIKRGTVTQMLTDLTTYEVYIPDTGQAVYESNRKACGAKMKLGQVIDFIEYAEEKILKEKWSPDAVCGREKLLNKFDTMVCTKTLYNYIERGLIGVKNIDLPIKVRLNPKKKRIREHKRILGKSIAERPVSIEDRKEFGHWEIDTVAGTRSKGAALLTITERKTRNEIIIKMLAKTKHDVGVAIGSLRKEYGTMFSQVFKTITSDNGSEFSDLVPSVSDESTDVYFARPYTASERGTNERHNGLIRRFIPKGKAIDDVSERKILYVEDWCNRLPRRILGYRTPEECFLEELSKLAA